MTDSAGHRHRRFTIAVHGKLASACVRAIGDDGVVYEAQLSNEQTGEYHGYPMKMGDGFAGFIGEEWERRGT